MQTDGTTMSVNNNTFLQPKKYSRNDISQILEQEITRNMMQPGIKLPTSVQLAKKYGVSSKTADRAIEKLVRTGLVSRIRGSGSYVTYNRKLQDCPYIAFFYWKQPLVTAELNYAAFDYGIELILQEFQKSRFRFDSFEENTLDKIHSRIFNMTLEKYDVIVIPAGLLEVAEHLLRNTPAEVILLNDDVVHPGPWHQIVYDYRPGFEKAIRYLLSQGCRKFFIAGDVDDDLIRCDVCREECLKLGVSEQDISVYRGSNQFFPSSILHGEDCAEYYIKNRLFDHAILSTSDFLTFGMLSTFYKSDYRPGRNFQIISYDNLESRLAQHNVSLGISSITHPLEMIPRVLTDLLRQLTANPPEGRYYYTCSIPALELVLRDNAEEQSPR